MAGLKYYCLISLFNILPHSECALNDILFLTPYIENGQLEMGKSLSKVDASLMNGVESYSGFITVDKKFNSNTWFWYFPVEGGNVAESPLIIWLQGGPGLSSTVGVFSGVGPFYFVKNKLTDNPFSWHKNHSLLFIDNPIGAGFSFTNSIEGFATNQTQISIHLYEFLIQFMQLYPELLPLPLYISGQSYAGKHVPKLVHYIHTRNPTAKTVFNIKGMMIGNGWIDPPNMYQYSDLIHQFGIGDFNLKTELKEIEGKIDNAFQKGNLSEANELCLDSLIRIKTKSGVSLYNYLKESDKTCFKLGFHKFLKKKMIRKALHVGNCGFTWRNATVQQKLKEDEMKSVVPLLEELLEHYEVFVFNGQLDLMVPYSMLQSVYSKMKWSGAENYKTAERVQMIYDDKLYGYEKKVAKFQELMVRNVGHCVISEKPKLLQHLITKFTCGSRCD